MCLLIVIPFIFKNGRTRVGPHDDCQSSVKAAGGNDQITREAELKRKEIPRFKTHFKMQGSFLMAILDASRGGRYVSEVWVHLHE